MTHKKLAFTLAEILIVIAIIGTISVIIIPQLMTNTQDKEFRVAFKKEYATVSQVTSLLINDNGGTLVDYFNTRSNYSNSCAMYDRYIKYLSSNRVCPDHATEKGCWHTTQTWYNFNGTPVNNDSIPFVGLELSGHAGVVTNDGAMMVFFGLGTWTLNCNYGPASRPYCAVIILDVNGFKPPNIIGKDIYYLYVVKDGIRPVGMYNEATCQRGTNGTGCAAYVLKNQEY